MELADFTRKVSDQFLEEDQPKVTAEIEFRSLPTWDSLTGMAILAMIDDEYKVSMPVEDFRQIKTVNGLFVYVKNKYSESIY